MLTFVQSFFAAKANPIGIDFGSDTIRMAQVRRVDNDFRLVAAASADVPAHVRHDPAARVAFFAEAIKELWSQGKFVGKQAVLALPASTMFIQHLRIAKMDEESRKKAIPWEARGKLPIDPSHAILRHHVAGEVFQEQEPREEVILMAASREYVNQLLAAAARARLDVVGMEVEPKAVIDCFGHVYRRKSDADVTNLFVDIGCCASRAVVARGSHILFARSLPVGGEHFNKAVASAFGVTVEEARVLRAKLGAEQRDLASEKAAPKVVPTEEIVHPAESTDNSFALLSASLARETSDRRKTGPSDPELAVEPQKPVPPANSDAVRVDEAVREPLTKLVSELDLCRRYYEATFASQPIDRVVFVGGEAHQRRVCQQVAMEMGLAAQVGDPMVRMARTCEVPPESGIERGRPQPSWAVAIGLSMGNAYGAANESTATLGGQSATAKA